MSNQAVKVKANARYTCQECGATELIQAHHISYKPEEIIVLCAECHSKRHPTVPRGLFLSRDKQPYWHNRSASSMAKEYGVHPRTIIRRAKKLGIDKGEITKEGIESLKWGKAGVPVELVGEKRMEKILTVNEVCAILRITRPTLLEWRREGKIKISATKFKRRVLFDPEEIRKALIRYREEKVK